MADSEGRFFFTQLPAGDYYIQATKPGYVRGSYGQRRPWGDDRRVTLRDGERRVDVELRVWKHAVIGGTVVDEAGEPVVGIAVRALEKTVFAGRSRFGNMQVIPELVPYATTDDRGMFRLAHLTPGTYVVVVPSTHSTVPAAVIERQDSTVRNELFWAGVTEISVLGGPQTFQVGDFALMTLNRVLIPPPPDASGRMQVYRTTFYPAAASASTATAIPLNAGEERTDLTVALRPVRALRVSGRLVAPDGSIPPPTTIRLVGESMNDVITANAANPGHVGLETHVGMSDARGRFALLGVPPGDYILEHATRFLARADREGKTAYWFSQPLTVGSEDIRDLTVELRPALHVEGRIEFRSTPGAKPAPPMRLVGVSFMTPFGEPGQFFAEMDRAASTFSSVAAGGRYIARAIESDGWVVQSVTLDGKDVTDRIFDLQADATVVVTYSDRPSKVSGTVTDPTGTPSATAVVLVFPVDPQRWSGYGSASRTLKTVVTNERGVYTFAHLPPGDYHVIALPADEVEGWQDPARLEALSRHATRLSVASGDSLKTLDLRVRATR
jgi:hypothetical protein